MAPFFAYVICPHPEAAEQLARELLNRRLVACANIIDRITSLYWLEGEIRRDRETVLILKTREELLTDLTDTICKLHAYHCPCVVAWPVAAGNPDFLRWIEAETSTMTPISDQTSLPVTPSDRCN
jgi:periplasmic divalent cation tolerance protein